MGIDTARYLGPNELEQEFICCICFGILYKPLVTACRHTFCEECIEKWFRSNSTCPLDQNNITTVLTNPPIILQNLIGRLMVKCSYSYQGCRSKVKIEDLEKHENQCPYQPREQYAARFIKQKAANVWTFFKGFIRRTNHKRHTSRITGRLSLNELRRREQQDFNEQAIFDHVFSLLLLILIICIFGFVTKILVEIITTYCYSFLIVSFAVGCAAAFQWQIQN